MKRKLTMFLALFFIGIGFAVAQTQVRGTVVDEMGEPVIGASILVKGTSQGTISDVDGNFTLSAPVDGTLVISYVGYQTQEVPVSASVRVTLVADSEVLDEVMVVAYGTAKKSSFTGSAATMKSESLEKMQVSNLTKSLEGAIAGVQTFSSSGQPGSSASINIRGLNSISAGKDPLIVVDGVPYEGSLNQINTHDVETMTILKDAAASALYGARGANGVIIITTKKGTAGKATVTIENRTGFNSMGVPNYSTVTDPGVYYELFWESMKNQMIYTSGYNVVEAGIFASNNMIETLGGYNAYDVARNQLIDPYTGRLNPNAKLMYNENWYDEAFKPGLRQENNISVSGGDDKTSYYASLNYLHDASYTENSSFDRVTLRLNLDKELTSWFRSGFNLSYANTTTNAPNVGGNNYSSVFMFGRMIAPIYPIYLYDKDNKPVFDKKGNREYDYGYVLAEGETVYREGRPYGAGANPIAQQLYDIRETNIDAINARVYAEFSFLKNFKLTVNASMDNFNYANINFQTPIGGDALNINGRSTKAMYRYNIMNFNQLLNYTNTFGNDHNVAVLLGHETKRDYYSELWAERTNFLIPDNPELANAGVLQDASSYGSGYALEGYFGQVQYNFQEKYYFSASLRGDASSKFHPSNRWGAFWSVGGSWRVTQENFMDDVEWLNDLKLKVSYGLTGNDNLPNNQPYLTQYVVVNQDGVLGLSKSFRGNPDITWEKHKSFNIGFDFRVFNKLTASFEYFRKDVSDMLYAKPLPPSLGLPSSTWENTMSMRNSGVELEVNWDVFKRKDFRWNLAMNLTHYKNQITELPPDRPQDGWSTGSYLRKLGKNIYNYQYYKYAGVDEKTGAPLYYKDIIENGEIVGTTTVNATSSATRYEIDKSPLPDVYGGISTTLEYKGFDFSVVTAGQIGGWYYDSTYASLMATANAAQTYHTDIYNRWTPDNTNTNVPRVELGNQEIANSSDRFLTTATHLSVKNVTLGYTFPTKMISKIGFERIRAYIVADNLWLFSARKGFDPRQSLTGDTGYTYSAVRTVSFGFNLTF
jgi:TonB-linked SusC/RagA family outer membrane protein